MDFDRVIQNRNQNLAKVLGPKHNFKSMVIGSLGILSVANLISKFHWCQDFQGNPVSDYHKAKHNLIGPSSTFGERVRLKNRQ